MPPVVIAAASIAVTYGATAGLITAGMAALISVGLLVASVAYADSEATKARREARAKYNASQVDRLQNITSTVAARELVLGRVRKGGTVIFRDSCGANNSKFVMVIALAGHEIDGVEKFFLNEKEVTVNSQGYVTTEPYSLRRTESWLQGQQPAGAELVSGSCYSYYEGSGDNERYAGENCQYYVYDSYARIRVVNGAQTTADARLMELFPGVWTAEHKLLGVAYAILEFDFNETAFTNGLPNFTCQLRGAKVYDPRAGATAFSTNPALHARHIALHPRFGKRTVLSAREEARIVAAANACDTSYTPSGGTAGALYTSNLVIPFGSRAADALDDLCQAMCGMWGYAGGEFFLKAGVHTAPVKALQASDLLTLQTDSQGGSNSYPVQITTHKARADKINSVTAKIYDAGKNYQENTTTPVENADALVKDGQRLPLEINLAAVSTASQAQVICNYMLKDSFDPLMIVASFKFSAYDIELFDNVSLTIPRYGWNAKVFKVFGRKFNPSGSIELTLKETSAQLYNPEIYSDSNGFSVNTNLVEPWEIDDPGVLTMSSGSSHSLLQRDGTVVTRVRVEWAEILDARIRQGGQVEVWWRPNNALNWTAITVPGVERSTYILGANDGSTIVVKARARTALAVSDWNVQATHLVLGKTESPGNVTGLAVSLGNQSLNLTWNKVADLDLAGYEVRSSDSGWGTGNEIYRGNATSIGVELTGAITTWYVRAFDRSGNYSLATASTSYTVTVSAVAQVSNISHVFADISLTSATVTISWVDAQPIFGLAYYEVAYLAEVITVRSNTITLPADWVGDRDFSITTVNGFGFKSAPVYYQITKPAPEPEPEPVAFSDGVLLPDGRVFCVPYLGTTARIYDPVTNTVTTPAGEYSTYGFYGGVLLPDGRVFCVPYLGTTARIYDPVTNTVTIPAGEYPAYAVYGGVLLPDGRVFCVPHYSTTARIYDPVTDTLTTPAGTYPSGSFYGGVLLPDGRVFCVPHNSTTARIYDPVTNTVTIPAGTYPGGLAFAGGVLLPDGRVFCVPVNSAIPPRIYDPVTDTLT